MSTTFRVNRIQQTVDVDPSKPLLWVIREQLGLTGTKFGCGISQCGACTVHIDGQAVRSCVTPISSVEGREVTTIEGIASADGGQIMSASALIANNPNPTDADIDAAMQGNICRCGMYGRIRNAIKSVGVASSDEKLFYDVASAEDATEVDHG
jgi:isoquinoline 1-oxidoreductase alpha subunit